MNFPAYTPSLHPADFLVPQSQQKFSSPRIVANRSQITETKHNNLSDKNRREVGVGLSSRKGWKQADQTKNETSQQKRFRSF
jgi:hypothetical protein